MNLASEVWYNLANASLMSSKSTSDLVTTTRMSVLSSVPTPWMSIRNDNQFTDWGIAHVPYALCNNENDWNTFGSKNIDMVKRRLFWLEATSWLRQTKRGAIELGKLRSGTQTIQPMARDGSRPLTIGTRLKCAKKKKTRWWYMNTILGFRFQLMYPEFSKRPRGATIGQTQL